jgi:hypothetical protein
MGNSQYCVTVREREGTPHLTMEVTLNSDDFSELLKLEINKTTDHPVPMRFLSEEGDVYDIVDVTYDARSDVLYIKGELAE